MIRPNRAAGMALALLLAAAPSARAAVKPHALFTNGAVLQRDIKVPVWGTADDGEKVTVSFRGQEVSAVAKGGRWRVDLEPMSAEAEGHILTIAGPSNRVEVLDVVIGEVWLCSGQSNMQWDIRSSEDPDKTAATATDPLIRLFTVPRRGADAPETDVAAQWEPCTPETAINFSAVAYAFGRSLRKALDIPVGLISTNFGGTPAEAWTSRKVLEADPKLKQVFSLGSQGAQAPTVLYNAMIAPLVPYAIRGAIWYQGESNAGRAEEYRTLFPAMIRNWRDDWGQGDFPFLFVQLAPFGPPPEPTWAELREAQMMTLEAEPRTGMVVITDLGDRDDIHPKPKAPVGERLALAARGIAYGEDLVFSGPLFRSMKVEGGKAVLSFDHVGGGLEARGGEPLEGFTIAGEDGKFVPAQAEIVGETVVVSSPDVEEPKAVRYGWSSFPEVNLFNEDGLPASPFRTDRPE